MKLVINFNKSIYWDFVSVNRVGQHERKSAKPWMNTRCQYATKESALIHITVQFSLKSQQYPKVWQKMVKLSEGNLLCKFGQVVVGWSSFKMLSLHKYHNKNGLPLKCCKWSTYRKVKKMRPPPKFPPQHPKI